MLLEELMSMALFVAPQCMCRNIILYSVTAVVCIDPYRMVEEN